MSIILWIKNISIGVILSIKIEIYIKTYLVYKIAETSLKNTIHSNSTRKKMRKQDQKMRGKSSFAAHNRGVKVPSFAIIE